MTPVSLLNAHATYRALIRFKTPPNLTSERSSPSERRRAVVRGGRGDHAAEQGRARLVEGPDRRGQGRRLPRQLRRASRRVDRTHQVIVTKAS